MKKRFLKEPALLINTYWVIQTRLLDDQNVDPNHDVIVVRAVHATRKKAVCLYHEGYVHYYTPSCGGRWEIPLEGLVHGAHYLGNHKEFGWIQPGAYATRLTPNPGWDGTWRISTIRGGHVSFESKPVNGVLHGGGAKADTFLTHWRQSTDREWRDYYHMVPSLTVPDDRVLATALPSPEVIETPEPASGPDTEVDKPVSVFHHIRQDPFIK